MMIQKLKNGIQLGQIAALRMLRRLSGKIVVHVIGDSHSLLFKDPIFQIHYIGSATAHRLGAVESTNKSREKILSIMGNFPSTRPNKALFVFGEIDCRVHIHKAQVEKGKSLINAVQETVGNYVNFLRELQKIYRNTEIIVFNALPQGEQGNYYRVRHYAKRSERMKITKVFNKFLRRACLKNKIKFVDIFDELLDSNGRRIRGYVFDDVHYNTEIVPIIIKNLREQGILTR